MSTIFSYLECVPCIFQVEPTPSVGGGEIKDTQFGLVIIPIVRSEDGIMYLSVANAKIELRTEEGSQVADINDNLEAQIADGIKVPIAGRPTNNVTEVSVQDRPTNSDNQMPQPSTSRSVQVPIAGTSNDTLVPVEVPLTATPRPTTNTCRCRLKRVNLFECCNLSNLCYNL